MSEKRKLKRCKLIGIIRCFQELGGNDADPDPEYIEANWLDYIPQCQGDAYQTGTVLLHKEATDETE